MIYNPVTFTIPELHASNVFYATYPFKPIYMFTYRHARIQKVLSEGSNSTPFLIKGERTKIPLKAGNHRPASEMPFKWRFAGVPMMTRH